VLVQLQHIMSEMCWYTVTTQYYIREVLVCSYNTLCPRCAGVQLQHIIVSRDFYEFLKVFNFTICCIYISLYIPSVMTKDDKL